MTINVIDAPNAFGFMVGDQWLTNIFVGQKYDFNVMFGGYGKDIFIGGDMGNMMFGGFGDNLMSGGKSADLILTGSGQDEVYGGGGADVIMASDDLSGWGNNSLFASGGKGNDLIQGANGDDNLMGDEGRDVVRGGDGFDFVFGGAGNDRLFGEKGDDYLSGDTGNDVLAGGAGNDRLNGGEGDDRMNGGSGADTFMFYDMNGGNDTITGYNEAVDTIILTGDYSLKQGSTGTTIHYDNGDIFVAGVTAFELAPTIYDDWMGGKG